MPLNGITISTCSFMGFCCLFVLERCSETVEIFSWPLVIRFSSSSSSFSGSDVNTLFLSITSLAYSPLHFFRIALYRHLQGFLISLITTVFYRLLPARSSLVVSNGVSKSFRSCFFICHNYSQLLLILLTGLLIKNIHLFKQ